MMTDLVLTGGNKFMIAKRKISIVMHDSNGKQIGKFFEDEDGKLDFEGDVTESGLKFIDFIKTTYNRN